MPVGLYGQAIDEYPANEICLRSPILRLPASLYDANDPAIVTEINRAMVEDMKAYASLLKSPPVEEQEEKEQQMLEELTRVARS